MARCFAARALDEDLLASGGRWQSPCYRPTAGPSGWMRIFFMLSDIGPSQGRHAGAGRPKESSR